MLQEEHADGELLLAAERVRAETGQSVSGPRRARAARERWMARADGSCARWRRICCTGIRKNANVAHHSYWSCKARATELGASQATIPQRRLVLSSCCCLRACWCGAMHWGKYAVRVHDLDQVRRPDRLMPDGWIAGLVGWMDVRPFAPPMPIPLHSIRSPSIAPHHAIHRFWPGRGARMQLSQTGVGLAWFRRVQSFVGRRSAATGRTQLRTPAACAPIAAAFVNLCVCIPSHPLLSSPSEHAPGRFFISFIFPFFSISAQFFIFSVIFSFIFKSFVPSIYFVHFFHSFFRPLFSFIFSFIVLLLFRSFSWLICFLRFFVRFCFPSPFLQPFFIYSSIHLFSFFFAFFALFQASADEWHPRCGRAHPCTLACQPPHPSRPPLAVAVQRCPNHRALWPCSALAAAQLHTATAAVFPQYTYPRHPEIDNGRYPQARRPIYDRTEGRTDGRTDERSDGRTDGRNPRPRSCPRPPPGPARTRSHKHWHSAHRRKEKPK